MLRRWRLEIASHEQGNQRAGFRQYAWGFDFAPLPPTVCDDSCHCYLGPGFFRKRHPLDCGNSRCGLCSFEKNYVPKARDTKRRRAIEFDMAATA